MRVLDRNFWCVCVKARLRRLIINSRKIEDLVGPGMGIAGAFLAMTAGMKAVNDVVLDLLEIGLFLCRWFERASTVVDLDCQGRIQPQQILYHLCQWLVPGLLPHNQPQGRPLMGSRHMDHRLECLPPISSERRGRPALFSGAPSITTVFTAVFLKKNDGAGAGGLIQVKVTGPEFVTNHNVQDCPGAPSKGETHA